MKRVSSFLIVVAVLLALLLLAVPAKATGCKVVAVKQAVVVEKQVVVAAALVVPVVAQYVAPVYAAPLYGATYAPQAQGHCPPPGQAQTDGDLAAAVKALAEQVRALTERVGGAPVMPPADPPEKPTKPTDPFNPQANKVNVAEQIVLARCASCHDASKSAAMGKGFTLSLGAKMKPLSGEDLGKIINEVSAGRMPRGSKMSEAERLQLIAALVNQ